MVSQKTTGPVGPRAANGMKYTHVLFYDGLHEKASPAVPCPPAPPVAPFRVSNKVLLGGANKQTPQAQRKRPSSQGASPAVPQPSTSKRKNSAAGLRARQRQPTATKSQPHNRGTHKHAHTSKRTHTHAQEKKSSLQLMSQKPVVSTRIFRNRSVV